MINSETILSKLLQYCPQFQATIDRDLDDEDRESAYAISGSFADFLLGAYKHNDAKVLQNAGAFIEELYKSDNDNVKQLATVGYLETIQNYWGNNGTDAEQFTQFLQPIALEHWRELNDDWKELTS
jgi:hypothetical protein